MSQPARRARSAPTFTAVLATGALRDEMFSLRYRSYLRDAYIAEDASGQFRDAYDECEACWSWLAYRDQRSVGSIRACLHDPARGLTAPAARVYPAEVQAFLGESTRWLEANKFVVDPHHQGPSAVRARWVLFRAFMDKAVETVASALVAAVRPEHVRFYRRLSFEPVSTARRYPDLNFETVLVVARSPQGARERLVKQMKGSPRRSLPRERRS